VARGDLSRFVAESNRVEGISRPPTEREIAAHEAFLDLPAIEVADLENLVAVCTDRRGRLRGQFGMDVIVGQRIPPPGGIAVVEGLRELLISVNCCERTPWQAHVEYECLHPFLDGNGRSGRALWAWQMWRDGLDPFALPFLHRFYYQTLDNARPDA